MESPREGARIQQKTDENLTREQLTWAGLREGNSVLDVACASGATTAIIAEYVGFDGSVVGLDLSAERLAEARRHASQRAAPAPVAFQLGDAVALPFGNAQFDFAWCRFLFEYLHQPEIVLHEMVRVVRPGGVVCVSDLDGNGIWTEPLPDWLRRERDDAVATLRTTGFDPHIGRRLYSMAVQAGLKDVGVRVQPYNVLAGEIQCESTIQRWELKHQTIAGALVKLGWSSQRSHSLISALRDRLRHPDAFSYSVLITVSGRR